MKKTVLLGAILSSCVFFAQKGDFSDGYAKGYYSVTKTQPKTVPVSPTWNVSPFGETYRYADTTEKKQAILDAADRKQYTDGYERGVRDGKLDVAMRKDQAKED